MKLPEGLIWKEDGRLAYCTVCCVPVAASSEKLVKQHCKSRTHKTAAQRTQVSAPNGNDQAAQPPSLQQQANTAVTCLAAEDYQSHHLEALHILGAFPDESPFAGLYYTRHNDWETSLHCATAHNPSIHDMQHHNSQQLDFNANPSSDVTQPASAAVACSSKPSSKHAASSTSQSDTKSNTLLIADVDQLSQQLQRQSFEQQQQQQQHYLEMNQQQNSCLQQQQQQQDSWQQQQQGFRPCWPPPFAVRPKQAVAAGQPFLTTVCGSIPCVPDTIDDALQWYCQPGTCRLPNIDIGGVNQQVKSWSHAAKLLRSAAAAADGTTRPFWASLVADISHPAWWPKTGHVPTYDNVIVGAGASGIGIHRDVDHSYCSNPPPVATYLTIVRGKKQVILLPPGQTLVPVDDEVPFPVTPTPELLQSIKAAGGAYFDLQPTPDGSPVTLFMPTGWLHWLLGAADWHVVFGGSCHMGSSRHQQQITAAATS